MIKYQHYLLYLINCIIKGEEAKLPDAPFDWEYFVLYAREQQFDHIIYPLFKDNVPEMDPKLWHILHQKYGHVVVRDSKQDFVLDEICMAISEAEIPHIPLKGSVIKELYPLPDIRRSIDFDILVHDSDMQKATEALQGIGFEIEVSDEGLHDGFSRGKSHVELHKMLTVKDEPSYGFCCDVWEYSSSEGGYTYRMTNEFLYVYMLVHLRKHLLLSGGAGIKLILDFYVMRRQLELDKDVLGEFCEKAHMVQFNETVVKLEKKWFEGENCTDKNVLIIEDMVLNSGAYGNYQTYVDMVVAGGSNSDVSGSKLKNLITYLFPPVSFLKEQYKILRKYPFVLPLVWIYRILKAEKGRRLAVIDSVRNYRNSNAAELRAFKEDMLK